MRSHSFFLPWLPVGLSILLPDLRSQKPDKQYYAVSTGMKIKHPAVEVIVTAKNDDIVAVPGML